MELEPQRCHRILLARDGRYDGRFFVCVKTTGVYCRPVCPARTPRLGNCLFVPTAAAAQEAGFRPCLRCRPESSPDLGAWRGSSATVSRALSLIEAGALDAGDVGALADRLGIGERQLRRLFRQHLGAAPVTVAQTRRVLLAKQLLHETTLPMAQVALASGFASLRRFNETFKQLYGRPPGELRGRRAPAPTRDAGTGLMLRLPYHPPYAFQEVLAFLAARAIPGVEAVAGGCYRRVIALDGVFGWIEVDHAQVGDALRVTIRFPRLSALPTIIARVRRLFDLGADPSVIGEVLGRDPVLGPLVADRPGLRVPGAWDGFEVGVRAILGQQITVAGATRLAGKLAHAFGSPLTDIAPGTGLTHAFPGPGALTAETEVAALGMPRARAAAICGMARATTDDPHLFASHSDLDATVTRLRTLPGIGEWTAQYIAMRALGESDAFVSGDLVVRRVFESAEPGVPATPAALRRRVEPLRPYRAYAVLHLWAAAAALQASTPTRQARHATTT